MRTIAVIPARGGSIAVPRKNTKKLCGKPLIAYTIEQAQECDLVDQVVVSTEDDEIAKVSREYGATVIPRPDYLAKGDVMVWESVKHVAKYYQSCHAMPDLFVELHTTYPFRTPELIDDAIKLMRKANWGGVMVASELYDRVWRLTYDFCPARDDEYRSVFRRVQPDIEIKPRQEQEPLYVDHYGLVNVYKPVLALHGNPYDCNLALYITDDKLATFDIDDNEDFQMAKVIMSDRISESHKSTRFQDPGYML